MIIVRTFIFAYSISFHFPVCTLVSLLATLLHLWNLITKIHASGTLITTLQRVQNSVITIINPQLLTTFIVLDSLQELTYGTYETMSASKILN